MRIWRDIISSEGWNDVMRKHDSTASISRTTAVKAVFSKDVSTPERVLKDLARKISDYHGIPKTWTSTIDRRRFMLEEIANMADLYLKKFHVDMDKAKQRAMMTGGGNTIMGTNINKWDKNPETNQYMSGTPQRESLDRNILTLRNRALRKRAYLAVLKHYYRTTGSAMQDPTALMRILRGDREETESLVGLHGGVRLEGLDPAHRPYEVKILQGGKVEEDEFADPYSCSELFRQWARGVDAGSMTTPFFMWLEEQPVCISDDKAPIAATSSVNYIRADQGQSVPDYDKLRVVVFKGSRLQELPLHDKKAKVKICDTRTFHAKQSKGGPGCAAFVWTADKELFIAEHQEGRFHHSTFVSGQMVRCAGMIKIINGVVQFVSNNSGHYKPPADKLTNFVRFLRDHGATRPDTRVLCLGKSDTESTIGEFLGN